MCIRDSGYLFADDCLAGFDDCETDVFVYGVSVNGGAHKAAGDSIGIYDFLLGDVLIGFCQVFQTHQLILRPLFLCLLESFLSYEILLHMYGPVQTALKGSQAIDVYKRQMAEEIGYEE